MWGRKRDWRKLDLESFLWVVLALALASSECLRSFVSLLPELLMRKKFLIFCETWLLEVLMDLFDDSGRPEKALFSVAMGDCWLLEELNNWVMKMDMGDGRDGAAGAEARSHTRSSEGERGQMGWCTGECK